MAEIAFAVPGDIAQPTGGYEYARRLISHLPAHGARLARIALPASFPHPGADDLAATAALLGAVGRETVLLVDGLAYGALPESIVAAIRAPIVALVHHPLALEAGLAPARHAALAASERAALAHARAVIATSRSTAALLAAAYAVPPARITVAEPGTEPAVRVPVRDRGAALLAVGAVSPRKGYDVLVRALATLGERGWSLRIVGSTDRDPAAAARLRALIGASGLGARITLDGALDAASLAARYDAADVLVSASLHEGYGMVLAEALARGLPVVTTTGGAAAETVPDAAALKVAPGDEAALAAAIARVIDEPALRRRLADAAWAAGTSLPRWTDTAAIVARVVERAGARFAS